MVERDTEMHLDWFRTVIVNLTSPTQSAPDLSGDDLWRLDRLRAFVSHIAEHKAFAADVSERLERLSVHGFVAHDSIDLPKSGNSSSSERCEQPTSSWVWYIPASPARGGTSRKSGGRWAARFPSS